MITDMAMDIPIIVFGHILSENSVSLPATLEFMVLLPISDGLVDAIVVILWVSLMIMYDGCHVVPFMFVVLVSMNFVVGEVVGALVGE